MTMRKLLRHTTLYTTNFEKSTASQMGLRNSLNCDGAAEGTHKTLHTRCGLMRQILR